MVNKLVRFGRAKFTYTRPRAWSSGYSKYTSIVRMRPLILRYGFLVSRVVKFDNHHYTTYYETPLTKSKANEVYQTFLAEAANQIKILEQQYELLSKNE